MVNTNIPVVILAGGKGMRMRNYSDSIPKGLVPIGGLPIIEHVIKIYQHYNLNQFIICVGYLGDKIKNHFKETDTLDIKIIDTGANTQTGGRIKKIEDYINTDNFFMTYCDGVSDVNINKLYDFHTRMGKIVTLTAVHPMSPFGLVEIEKGNVIGFKEKPMLSSYINGGFFVFNKQIFSYLNEDSVLEDEILRKLVREKQVTAYTHEGFWACMDTPKDVERLNSLWDIGFMPNVNLNAEKPPWKIWD